MAELLIRVGSQDEALMRRLLLSQSSTDALPSRMVLDAHVAARTNGNHDIGPLAAIARAAGFPLLVDPQTHFLQDWQHLDDPWAAVSFATAGLLGPGDLGPARQDQLVEQSLVFQLEHGATQLLLPGLHIERADDGWTQVQRGLFQRARRFLDRESLRLPVIAPIQLSWRLLVASAWEAVLDPLLRTAVDIGASEVALAASKVDQGAHPEDRLADLVGVVQHVRRRLPVIAWQQGTLGEACVAAGAVGYECGIGWRERCDLRAAAASHRKRNDADQHFGRRPVYIGVLRRSLPAASVEILVGMSPVVRAEMVCTDFDCCPRGVATLTGDARQHAIVSRARSLRELSGIHVHSWRWASLATSSEAGLALATRINRIAASDPRVTHVDTAALAATRTQALVRRRSARGLAA